MNSYLETIAAQIERHDQALKNLDMIFGDKQTQAELQNDLQVNWQTIARKLLPVALAAQAVMSEFVGECPMCDGTFRHGHAPDCEIGALQDALKALESEKAE